MGLLIEQKFEWNKRAWSEHIDSVCSLLGEYEGYLTSLIKRKDCWVIVNNNNGNIEAKGNYGVAKTYFLLLETLPIL